MRMVMTKTVLACVFIAAGISITIAAQSRPRAQGLRQVGQRAHTPSVKLRVLFNRYQVPVMTVFIADADGKNEHSLVPNHGLAYSPSYSADGHWVVFTAERDGQADIYRIHPDGTGLQQLTDDPAFDDQGALSPDGKTLAFVSTRSGGTANIWLMDLSSKRSTNLTQHHSGNFRPSWSPDGGRIAFTSDRDSQPGSNPGMWEHLQSTGVYVIKADGKDLRRLTRNDGVAGSPSWSADGQKVLFYETDEVGAYLAKSGQSRTEIVSIDVTTGERKQYTASNETKLSPRWLSDGRISYIKRAGDDTGGLRIWHPNRRVDTVIRGAVRNASWSPDGKSVVYERISRLGSTEHLVPTFSPDADFELFLSEPFPFFSPDGTKLLYSQYGLGKSATTGLEFSSTQNTSIETMNASGTDKRTLFHREGFSAFSGVWSPAGDEIALSVGRYFRAAGLPPAQIGLIKPDGSDFRLIVDDGVNNGFPSWSPDGTRLVFKRGRQLVIMSLADRKITPLTDGDHYNNFPQWSPKRDRIMFTSDRDGDFELYTIRHDGTQLRRLTNVRGNDAHAAWCSAGDWIVFSSARRGFKDEMALYDAVPQPYGEIFAMRADGSDVRQLTDNKWEDSSAACRPEWPVVSTVIGTGTPGYSDHAVNNPYGVEVGPDGALYFCDLDNQLIRRLDLKTGRTTTVAGSGKRGYSGDGGPATEASLNMPHEIRFDSAGHLYIAERDNHVIRKVDRNTGVISTFAGTGIPGFAGDGGPATRAQLRQPHSIAFDPQGRLMICDIGNHRIRRVDPSGATIETYAGTGERQPTPDGAPLRGTPLNGPRTIALDPDGNLYLALREGNAIYRINPKTETIHHVAGTGAQGYSGDGGPARLAKLAGPKGLAYARDHQLYVADTENHVIRRIALETGVITTVLGTGERGDGPEPDPLRCRLARPHGIFADGAGVVYVGDSEAHRIRRLQ